MNKNINTKLEKLLFTLVDNKLLMWSQDETTYKVILNKNDMLMLFSTSPKNFNIRINGEAKPEYGDKASTALLINSRSEIINFLTYITKCSEINRRIAYIKDHGEEDFKRSWNLADNVLKGIPIRKTFKISCSNARTFDFDRLIEIDSLDSKDTIEVKFPSDDLFMGNISINVKIKNKVSFMRFITPENIDEYPYLKKICRIFDNVEKPVAQELTSCDEFIERLKVYKNKEISSLALSMSLEKDLNSKEIINPKIKI